MKPNGKDDKYRLSIIFNYEFVNEVELKSYAGFSLYIININDHYKKPSSFSKCYSSAFILNKILFTDDY